MHKNTLLTVSEVSKILRINKNSVYNLINSNRLPAIKGLGTIKIKSEDVNELLESCYKGGSNNV